jgi:hypothetical protein
MESFEIAQHLGEALAMGAAIRRYSIEKRAVAFDVGVFFLGEENMHACLQDVRSGAIDQRSIDHKDSSVGLRLVVAWGAGA